MKTVGAYEAKTHLPKLLERVAEGETITITKHGVPVATLLAANPTKNTPVNQVIEQLRQFRRNRRLGRLSLRAMIELGRS
jgi:prevent-host-death family protein